MEKESVLMGVAGLVLGVLLTGFIAGTAVNNNNTGMMRMMGVRTEQSSEQSNVTDHSQMSMADMTKQLQSLNGDEYDKAFVEMMIAHHQGAIDMAVMSEARAKHAEVKTLSDAIIVAQTKEIQDMKQWQKDWGYGATEMQQMMHNH